MKVLKMSEDMLSFFDVFQYEVFESPPNMFLKLFHPKTLMIFQLILIFSSAGYCTTTEDLNDWIMAVTQTISIGATFGAFLWVAAQLENAKSLHDELQEIVNDGKLSGTLIAVLNKKNADLQINRDI